MNILVAYYTRTGSTGRLAAAIAAELKSRGHAVAMDRLAVVKQQSKWTLLIRQIHQYPLVGLALLSKSFRRWWQKRYFQPEDDLLPPAFPDVSEFHHVCIGGPKWAYTAYPVARYLNQIKGLKNQNVSAFATFGGPPLKVMELDLIFTPMGDQIHHAGGRMACTLGLSSNFHELPLIWIFRLLSWLFFRRPIASFTSESDYGKQKIREFCDGVEASGAGTQPQAFAASVEASYKHHERPR
ncbi:MAG: hypothetical protein RBT16_13210 [Desulfococcus multivorans]|jgi:hypothetical protein|nr:hypothetical protein [Desulfococcus multivorans]